MMIFVDNCGDRSDAGNWFYFVCLVMIHLAELFCGVVLYYAISSASAKKKKGEVGASSVATSKSSSG